MHSVEPVYGCPYTVHCRWDRSFLSEDLREAEKLYRDFLRGYSLLTLVEWRNCNACRIYFFFFFFFFFLRNLSLIILMGLNSPKPKKRIVKGSFTHFIFYHEVGFLLHGVCFINSKNTNVRSVWRPWTLG